ncbi:MAG: hypothetical protein AAB353_14240 [Candidatus Hydrogenedentota bacterium]
MDESNTRPVVDAAGSTLSPSAPVEAKARVESCARCGRAFRGDWDRIETRCGLLCYICSNQPGEGISERVRIEEERKAQIRPDPLTAQERNTTEMPGKWWEIDTQSREFKMALWCLALGTVALAIYMTGEHGSMPERRPGWAIADQDADPKLPRSVTYAIIGWDLVAAYACTAAAMYLALRQDMKLPHESFWRNAAYISMTIVACTPVMLVAIGGYYVFSDPFSIMRGVWIKLIFPLAAFVQLIIVSWMLDFGARNYFMLFIYMIPCGTLATASHVLVTWVFSLIYL